MTDAERTQDLMSRLSGAEMLAGAIGRAFLVFGGEEARGQIEDIRDQLIHDLKNSGITPDREMEHAQIVRPSLEIIELLVEGILRDA